MQLTDRQIRQYVENGELGITPYNRNKVKSNSYDVRIDNEFIFYEPYPGIYDDYEDYSYMVIDPYDKESVELCAVRQTCDEYILYPQEFVLAQTIEHITLPNYMTAQLAGKSSIARLGISNHQTAGFVDAGFSGTLTLELFNANCRPVKLYAGMDFGQLVFTVGEAACIPYNKRTHSKYSGQTHPELSKYYLNMKPYYKTGEK